MTREQAYLAVVEGWLRDHRGIVFTEGAVDDLCDRIAAEVERLTAQCTQASTAYMLATDRAQHYEAEVERLRANQKELLDAIQKAREFLDKLVLGVGWPLPPEPKP
jgi:thymidylate kinase